MEKQPSLTILIPAFNEEDGVSNTVISLKETLDILSPLYQVNAIFIDDGSQDQTAALLRQAIGTDTRLEVVSHSVNRGLGAAIRTGFEHASGDLVVTTDFDRTYDFATIPQIIRLCLEEQADIVSASPYHPQGKVENVPRYRLIFSFGASLLYRLLVSWQIHTWTALFRVYWREVTKQVRFSQDGFLAGTELLVRALQQGYRVVEFPTTLYARSFGQSSIRIAGVTLSHLQFQGRLLLEKLRLIPRE